MKFFDYKKFVLEKKDKSFIGRIDKNIKGGLGVVLDDLVAGLFGGILTLLIWKILQYL